MKQTIVMLDYLNVNKSNDTFSKIITYIFENKLEVPILTINELADRTYVTPATISRFCKHFGFRSYIELKDAINRENRTDSTRLFRLSKEDFSVMNLQPSLSFESYGNEIIHSIQDTLNVVTMDMINQLLTLIHEHNHISIFGYSSSNQSARSLQEGLLLSNKLVTTSRNDDIQTQLAASLESDSLAIIISSYGNFFNTKSLLFDQILNSGCQVALLTQQQNIFTCASIDHLFCINSQNFQKIGSYSMNFFIDFLCRKYFDTYSRE